VKFLILTIEEAHSDHTHRAVKTLEWHNYESLTVLNRGNIISQVLYELDQTFESTHPKAAAKP
jgi:hypothetical protein